MIGLRGTDQAVQADRAGRQGTRRPDGDQAHAGDLTQVRQQTFQALAVDEGHLGAGILDAIDEVRPQAPGVERRHHRADRLSGPEGQRPLRQIAHGDDDAVALPHAVALGKDAAQGAGGPEVGVIGLALVAIDNELARAPGAAEVEDLAQA